MLHDRILLLVQYVTGVVAGMQSSSLANSVYSLVRFYPSGSAKKDYATLRALSALLASLPASEDKNFRDEFDTVSFDSPYLLYTVLELTPLPPQEYEDVQLTAYLSTLTKSANILNDVCTKHTPTYLFTLISIYSSLTDMWY